MERERNEDSISHQRSLLNSFKTAVVVLGTFIVIFVAGCNTITWHLQKFWGASGDLWQLLWDPIHDWFDGDEYAMAVYGTGIVTTFAFWISNAFFIALDLIKPKWAARYRIQDNETVNPYRLLKAIIHVLFNEFVIGYPMAILSYRLAKWRGCNFGRELPTFHWVVYELFICIWVEEIMFYYSHRLLHHPKLYKYIHKVHHEWTAPIGITALYAHPLEHIIANLLPPMLGPILCGSHIATMWLWYSLALFSTTISHCGYHFPFLPSPEAHDYHHLKFTQNFGMLGVLDRLHGTDNRFRNSKQYERHFMALSLVPVKELYSDEKIHEK